MGTWNRRRSENPDRAAAVHRRSASSRSNPWRPSRRDISAARTNWKDAGYSRRQGLALPPHHRRPRTTEGAPEKVPGGSMTTLSCNAHIVRQWTTMTKTPGWIYLGNPSCRFRHLPSLVGQAPHFSSLRTLKQVGARPVKRPPAQLKERKNDTPHALRHIRNFSRRRTRCRERRNARAALEGKLVDQDPRLPDIATPGLSPARLRSPRRSDRLRPRRTGDTRCALQEDKGGSVFG